jgi:hypothetical protein
MTNIIDRMADYFDSKGKTFGERYTRCLIGFLYAWCGLGFKAGMMLGAMVSRP